ncbi:molybdate ABC transporter substrate-binding protein [Streptomyces sp. NPDC005438]|uniref:molybdate ABC transporter substrate-binding protein n=1 Tax=Streptomyces sp. NPDC005438 TaxID=3156880 RepID=UPI0033BCDD21
MTVRVPIHRLPTRRRTLTTWTGAAVLALLVPLTGCGGSDKDSGDNGGDRRTITVLAAASLTDAFEKGKASFEKEHPDVRLRFSFAGSQELAAQVRQGVPADVLVTADQPTMDKLDKDTGTPKVIARNRLTIVTPKGNPEKVNSLKDLSRSGLKVVLGAPDVPVGNYARQVLKKERVNVKPASEEANVRAVLSKVRLDEADAGIVYVTDAHSAKGKVAEVAIPTEQNALASYPAATLKNSKHPEQAREYTKWLSSAKGWRHLADQGFEKP